MDHKSCHIFSSIAQNELISFVGAKLLHVSSSFTVILFDDVFPGPLSANGFSKMEKVFVIAQNYNCYGPETF